MLLSYVEKGRAFYERRAAIIKVGVANGITNLKEIRNKFEEGGPIEQQLREQYPHYTAAG